MVLGTWKKKTYLFYARNQKKAHILHAKVVTDLDCDYFQEQKESVECTEYVSEEDSDYNGSDVSSECTDTKHM